MADDTVDDRIDVVQGDITRLDVDAVVNAANKQLKRGGGVDGAIHKAAGPELQKALDGIGGCPAGEAVVTDGFNLPAGHIIHTVGPVWHGGDEGEDETLASAYRTSLAKAEEVGAARVAFPAISTGVYNFPQERAAEIAVQEARAWLREHDTPQRVVFCAFDAMTTAAYEKALAR
ncbi:O-acetyl-ADP-ribose deacetylase (regulator of RNase III), contains Macro domain [Limimonas halophila]|uniref:O-acetyl-ADP-ribose deacetylase (Regulator of RNase III), contains Macro domain n=1 Tax=Limimonas halophila TaxID=1082479 RepID=A0A1G7S3S4_9PROT|nr:O-acetyl-ADP-ribose deacetylase [Limimonas halophila]SDG17648.1 O-acetyl-ADP-ribose deacetylase (regulator of RNase III), contains Macro domain [Limimonas halophila]